MYLIVASTRGNALANLLGWHLNWLITQPEGLVGRA
jgi:hypothetical protein